MAQWTYSRNVQLINELCTVGFLNLQVVKRSLKAQKRSRHFS